MILSFMKAYISDNKLNNDKYNETNNRIIRETAQRHNKGNC